MRFGIVLFLLLACFFTLCYSIRVTPRRAEIQPRIVACQIGEVVNISCRLVGGSRYNATDLQLLGPKTVFDSHVVNKTSIVAKLGPVNLEWDNTYVYCGVRNGRNLSRRKIYVGYPPEAPSNISCVSYNNVYMICNITGIPKKRDNLTEYWTIEYTNRGLGGAFRQCNTEYPPHCCVIGKKNPFYPDELHIFRIIVKNVLGSKRKLFEVEPHLVVKLDAVDGVRAVILNSTCLNVTWSEPSLIIYDRQYIIIVNSTLSTPTSRQLTSEMPWALVSNLPPYSKVNISVQCRPQHGGYSSDPTFVSVIMPQDKPSPPVVPTGSYSVISQTNDSREVMLYWQTIPIHLQHGIITQYKVSVFTYSQPEPVHTQGIQNTSVSVLVEYTLERDLDYRLALQAGTVEGFSDIVTSAEVVVPAENKVRNAVSWVDTELVDRDTYTVYWAPTYENGTFIVRVYWCYGEWRNNTHVVCNTSIQMKNVAEDWKRGIDISVPTVEKTCAICMWHFGVSMEINGINGGIVWNNCRFKKYKAPDLDDVTIHDVTETSLTVTWEPSCKRVDYIGRPNKYELGLVQGSTSDQEQCQNADTETVPASHDSMTKNLTTSHTQSVTVCIRPVSGTKPGRWVTRTVFIPGAVIPGGMTVKTIAWISVTFVILITLFFLLSACFCKKRKCFDKIHIDTSMLAKDFATLDEEKKFLPPSTGDAYITKKQGAPPDETEPLRSSGDSSRTRETVLTGTTITPESTEETPQNNTNTDTYCSKTETNGPMSGTKYATVTAFSLQSTESRHDSSGSISRSSYEYDEQKPLPNSSTSSFENMHDSYDAENYLQMVYTTNQNTGCNVYLKDERGQPVTNEEYLSRTKCKSDWSMATQLWNSQMNKGDNRTDLYSDRIGCKFTSTHTAQDILNRKNTNMNRQRYCQCPYCLSQRELNDTNPNEHISLSNGYVTTRYFHTSPWPGTGRHQCRDHNGFYSIITSSRVEDNDPIMDEVNYVKMSSDDVLRADMSNGNVCEEYSRVTLSENT